ncbi:MAG: stage III sporulation protein AB [Clostridiales bacterium]|nr:stage III sporulation protein AB [Clostridiales bacterium]
MWKLMGTCCILLGAAGGAYAWQMGKKERIHRIEDIIIFLRHMADAVERQMPMIDFLQSCQCRDACLKRAAENAAKELAANRWATGEAAWTSAIYAAADSAYIRSFSVIRTGDADCGGGQDFAGNGYMVRGERWNLSVEELEALTAIGQVFDAAGKEVLLDTLFLQKKRWEGFLEEERKHLVQKQKVVWPVGLLSGVMLVLLLL